MNYDMLWMNYLSIIRSFNQYNRYYYKNRDKDYPDWHHWPRHNPRPETKPYHHATEKMRLITRSPINAP